MAASALQSQFDDIRRAEMFRLRGKISAMTTEERAAVDEITAQVVRAIAAPPAHALTNHESPLLVRAVIDLFKVS